MKVVLVVDPLIDPELFPFSVTDHVLLLGIPLSLNVTVNVVCVNVTVTVLGFDPDTVTDPCGLPEETEYPATDP